jgi:hypothetical protein
MYGFSFEADDLRPAPVLWKRQRTDAVFGFLNALSDVLGGGLERGPDHGEVIVQDEGDKAQWLKPEIREGLAPQDQGNSQTYDREGAVRRLGRAAHHDNTSRRL